MRHAPAGLVRTVNLVKPYRTEALSTLVFIAHKYRYLYMYNMYNVMYMYMQQIMCLGSSICDLWEGSEEIIGSKGGSGSFDMLKPINIEWVG